VLQGKTQSLVDEVNEGALRVVNFVLANRHKLVSSKDACAPRRALSAALGSSLVPVRSLFL
jgi:hypothetical protein